MLLLPALVLGSVLWLARPKRRDGKAARFTPGPGGYGRIYGVPNVNIPAPFWTSSRAMMGCDWAIEGHGFLPSNAVILPPRESLSDALDRGESAWPFVAWLLDVQKVTPDQAAGAVIASVVAAVFDELSGCPAPHPGSSILSWRNDVASRIAAYAARATPTRTRVTATSR